MRPDPTLDSPTFLAGVGAMGALMRAHGWANTALGPPENWPQSLRTVVRLVLTTNHPMFVFWGPDHLCFYNDRYAASLGPEKHPAMLGAPAQAMWPEVWHFIGPQIRFVLAGEGVTWHEDQLVPIIRRGGLDDVYWTYGFSPIDDDTSPRGIGGVLVVCTETTERVLAGRRVAFQLELTERLRDLADPVEIMAAASGLLGRHLGASQVAYAEIDEAGEFAIITRDWNDGSMASNVGRHQLSEFGPMIAELRRGETVAVADVATDPRTCEPEALATYRRVGVSAFLDTPLFRDGRWVAVLAIMHAVPRSWSAQDTALVMDVAERTWIAIERARAVVELRQLNATLEQRVEERTRERDGVWNNSQDLQTVADLDGTIRVVNEAWTSMLGWRAEELVGHGSFEFIHPDDHLSSGGALATARSTELPTFENRYRHRDGSYRWISWLASPHGGLIYGSGRDVTADKRAAAELAQAQEQLRRAQKMEAVGQLTGGIAHDFNNMMQGVVSALALMQRRIGEERYAELPRYAGFAMTAAQQAAALTQRLLAFARRQPLDPKPVDANRLVASMRDLLRRTLGPTVTMNTTLDEDPWPILCDPNQLENAILNMAINARDAMPTGGTLTIETANARIAQTETDAEAGTVRAGDYVSVGVTDTGIGMASEVLAQIFEPFYTTKPLGQGTGLGLSMVYGFVTQSGGFARVTSAPGCGTTLRLFLPRSDIAAETEPDKPASAALPRTAGTVLLVEDEAAVRGMVAEALAESGFRVLEAADGATGLQIVRSEPGIELLLTDVGLPGRLNGSQLADAARLARPGLPVLFITGYAHNELGDSGAFASGIELMSKPFDLDALAIRIRTMLGREPVIAQPG